VKYKSPDISETIRLIEQDVAHISQTIQSLQEESAKQHDENNQILINLIAGTARALRVRSLG
jgi:uncharacterized protein with PhoU and TrkA domain